LEGAGHLLVIQLQNLLNTTRLYGQEVAGDDRLRVQDRARASLCDHGMLVQVDALEGGNPGPSAGVLPCFETGGSLGHGVSVGPLSDEKRISCLGLCVGTLTLSCLEVLLSLRDVAAVRVFGRAGVLRGNRHPAGLRTAAVHLLIPGVELIGPRPPLLLGAELE
jgi:hypothetical protein